jgi:CheY-like chemotaxis protein
VQRAVDLTLPLTMASSRTERPVVLIVEDEFLIRMHAAEMITEAGYDVLEASNADDSIAILETRRCPRAAIRSPRSGISPS